MLDKDGVVVDFDKAAYEIIKRRKRHKSELEHDGYTFRTVPVETLLEVVQIGGYLCDGVKYYTPEDGGLVAQLDGDTFRAFDGAIPRLTALRSGKETLLGSQGSREELEALRELEKAVNDIPSMQCDRNRDRHCFAICEPRFMRLCRILSRLKNERNDK